MRTKLNESRKTAYPIWVNALWGLGFGLMGVGIIIFIFGIVWEDIRVSALAFGVVSVALGFIAIAMGGKSDARMKALANLEFEARLGSIETTLLGGPSRSLERNNVVMEAGLFTLTDLRAMVTIAKWADEDRRKRAHQVLHGLPGFFEGRGGSDKATELAIEVRQLCSQV